jgi:hypothetical protein
VIIVSSIINGRPHICPIYDFKVLQISMSNDAVGCFAQEIGFPDYRENKFLRRSIRNYDWTFSKTCVVPGRQGVTNPLIKIFAYDSAAWLL